ncbi:MFS transporter [Gryllotalpicola sp.]|uniref:MFS transporter n=1 Tax=Gryllotalpicola sp. TaxID=1932787 RepID=UPI00261E13C2|nr:MFS transporter [Gryllotalpicola sp.]
MSSERRAWFVYAAALFAYVVAFTQRTTIGVAGVAATDRFDTNAALLSTLAVLQIAVYAGLQVPVGVLLDRLGPRALMIAGTVLMTIGQVAVAYATTVPLALAGRVIVGVGDAAMFVSAVRIVNVWIPPRQVPLAAQILGATGTLGQVISAVPFALLLRETGWTVAFLTAAAFAALGVVVVLVGIADRPTGTPAAPRPATWTQSIRQLGDALRRPGTQLGFWTHFISQPSGTVIMLIWGVPFLVYGLGYPPPQASAMLLVVAGAGLVSGPVLGILAARFPMRRSALVLGIVSTMFALWTVVLAWPGRPPLWLVVLLFVAIGVGGPGALIGFDFARSFNPQHALSSANGIVNVGGFLASFIIMYLVGVLLDVAHTVFGQPMYSLDSFRFAFLAQYLVVGIGVGFLLHARRRTRRRMHDEEGIEVAPLWVALSRAWRRPRA